MNKLDKKQVLDSLLYQYDFVVRAIGKDRDDYLCGRADAFGQAIIDIGRLFGESGKPYKFEAFKRVMFFESVEKYVKDYPEPIFRVPTGPNNYLYKYE